jgi:dGTP triphosphohydrolase
VIDRPSLSSIQRGQSQLIRKLFDGLIKWVEEEYPSHRMGRPGGNLPPRLVEYVDIAISQRGTPDYTEQQRTSRAVIDYIVSLTESQAIELGARITGHTRRSILESWFQM